MSKGAYKAVAKKLGVKYLFGRWGVIILPKRPDGFPYKLVEFVPLDNWITDPKELEHEMRERGFEL